MLIIYVCSAHHPTLSLRSETRRGKVLRKKGSMLRVEYEPSPGTLRSKIGVKGSTWTYKWKPVPQATEGGTEEKWPTDREVGAPFRTAPSTQPLRHSSKNPERACLAPCISFSGLNRTAHRSSTLLYNRRWW